MSTRVRSSIYLSIETRCEKEIKCSASLAFYLFSPTRLINSIKHEHSCKILYLFDASHVYIFSRLLDVLEVVAPFKQFQKLREFMENKLPPGFPVKLGMCFIYLSIKLVVSHFKMAPNM